MFITPSCLDETTTVEENSDNASTSVPNESPRQHSRNNTTPSHFETFLDLLRGAAGGYSTYHNDDTEHTDTTQDRVSVTIKGVAQELRRDHDRELDKKQYITYEIICCSFLLSLLDQSHDRNKIMKRYTNTALSIEENQSLATTKKLLQSRGGKEQLRLFLTGPAGAGKTTAIKAAETFCYRFCQSTGIPWTPTTFFYTAYTGSAASAFGGRTIIKASGMKSQRITATQRMEWETCRILVIDEISFMKESELIQLDNKLRLLGHPNKIYGGFSIIFGGDFRQLTRASKKELMYSLDSKCFFETNLNGVIILQNEHRFRNDMSFGKLLSDFWAGDLTAEQRDIINTRVVGTNEVTLPQHLQNDDKWNYACPTNRERNSIAAGIFKKHVEMTCPHKSSPQNPPNHTIIIESTFGASAKNNSKKVTRIKNSLLHRILTTCGDSDITYSESKRADPALCLYKGVNLFYVSGNEEMTETPPRGNGTVCKFVSVKFKDNAISRKTRIYNGHKVWAVSIEDIQWITVELMDNSDEVDTLEQKIKDTTEKRRQSQARDTRRSDESRLLAMKRELDTLRKKRRFKIKPERRGVTITMTPSRVSSLQTTINLQMTLLPVNISTAATGHKLQGRSKDSIIITSWPNFTNNVVFANWEYVVLSRVRTLDGLYLFKPIDTAKSFAPSEELRKFIKRARTYEKQLLKSRKRAIKRFDESPPTSPNHVVPT